LYSKDLVLFHTQQLSTKQLAKTTLTEPTALSFIPLRSPWNVAKITQISSEETPNQFWIYCSLCPYVLQTAISLRADVRNTPTSQPRRYHSPQVVTRPDNRIKASCCGTESIPSWLPLLIDQCKRAESSFGRRAEEHVEFIDRQWMEERMFDAEYGTQQYSLVFQDIRYVLKEHSKRGWEF